MFKMKAFVDASYDSTLKVAVLGYNFEGEEEIWLDIVHVDGVAEAEKLVLKRTIELFEKKYPNENLTIFTDHQASLKIETPENVTIEWIKGHKPRKDKTEDDKSFSEVDRNVRRRLRRYRNDHMSLASTEIPDCRVVRGHRVKVFWEHPGYGENIDYYDAIFLNEGNAIEAEREERAKISSEVGDVKSTISVIPLAFADNEYHMLLAVEISG